MEQAGILEILSGTRPPRSLEMFVVTRLLVAAPSNGLRNLIGSLTYHVSTYCT